VKLSLLVDVSKVVGVMAIKIEIHDEYNILGKSLFR
jgi:hypothetical protein